MYKIKTKSRAEDLERGLATSPPARSSRGVHHRCISDDALRAQKTCLTASNVVPAKLHSYRKEKLLKKCDYSSWGVHRPAYATVTLTLLQKTINTPCSSKCQGHLVEMLIFYIPK